MRGQAVRGIGLCVKRAMRRACFQLYDEGSVTRFQQQIIYFLIFLLSIFNFKRLLSEPTPNLNAAAGYLVVNVVIIKVIIMKQFLQTHISNNAD